MSLPESVTIEYATPRTRSRKWFYFVDLLIVGMLVGWWSFLLLSIVPHFRDVFSDFKTSLPLPTEYLLALSDGYCYDYFWLGALAFVFVAPLPINWLRRRCQCSTSGPAVMVFILAEVIAALVLLGITFVAMQYCLIMPLVKLIQSVSGGS